MEIEQLKVHQCRMCGEFFNEYGEEVSVGWHTGIWEVDDGHGNPEPWPCQCGPIEERMLAVVDSAELAALETALAAKDEALQQAALRFELLAIAGIGMTNGVDPMAGVKDCHAALTDAPHGEVMSLEQLKAIEWASIQNEAGDVNTTCVVCGSIDYPNHFSGCWLAAKIKQAKGA